MDGKAQATFADVAFPKKVIAQRPYTGDEVRPSTAWHAQFERFGAPQVSQ